MRHLATFGVSFRGVGQPTFLSLPAFLAVALLAVAAPSQSRADDAWQAVTRFRANLVKDSPLTAEFTQTYLPAGFSSGDGEPGSLAISLPACLRWDYTEPFPKSFLLCDESAWYWNPGETVGQRYSVDQQTAGLDFFLMPTEALKDRYRASLQTDQAGQLLVTLEPTVPTEDVVSASLRLDPKNYRLQNLSYVDIEGNRTDFEIKDYQVGQTFASEKFKPPPGIEWQAPE